MPSALVCFKVIGLNNQSLCYMLMIAYVLYLLTSSSNCSYHCRTKIAKLKENIDEKVFILTIYTIREGEGIIQCNKIMLTIL